MEDEREMFNNEGGEYQRMERDELQIREILDDLLDNYKKQKIEVPPKGDMTMGCGELCCMYFFNLIFMICIIPICCGFYTVEPLQAVVLMFMGKVIKVQKQPGLSWYWPIGRQVKVVSLGINTLELKGSSVPDQNGSPMNVSAIVTYQIVDPMSSLFNVDNFTKYINDQGLEVLKRVLSRFPYRSSDPDKPSLLDDTMIIGTI